MFQGQIGGKERVSRAKWNRIWGGKSNADKTVVKSGADFWTGCSSQPYGLRFSDDCRVICNPFVAAYGGIPDLCLFKGCGKTSHKYSNAFVFAIISIKWDQNPRTHGDDKQISLRPHSPLGCPTSCSSHNAAQLLHTRLCANKQTHKYTRRRSETAAPCASGPDRCEAGRQPFGCGVHQRDTKGAAALKS